MHLVCRITPSQYIGALRHSHGGYAHAAQLAAGTTRRTGQSSCWLDVPRGSSKTATTCCVLSREAPGRRRCAQRVATTGDRVRLCLIICLHGFPNLGRSQPRYGGTERRTIVSTPDVRSATDLWNQRVDQAWCVGARVLWMSPRSATVPQPHLLQGWRLPCRSCVMRSCTTRRMLRILRWRYTGGIPPMEAW